MMIKKYSFNKILKLYNKTYQHNYKISPAAFDATIIREVEANRFYVTFQKVQPEGLLLSKTKASRPLGDFIYYYVSIQLSKDYIKNIILSGEEKKLSLKIKIWPPNKIKYAYLYSNYFAKGVGDLGKSCMRNKSMQKSLKFYIRNGAKIVVVVDNNNKIHARALLWDSVKSTKNKKVFTYLDRVYTKSTALLPLFCNLAKENNWVEYNSTSADNAKKDLYMDNLDIKSICHFPYTDTFRKLYYKDNLVASSDMNSKVKYTSNKINLTTTGNDGYFPELDPDRVQEALTGQYISKKDATFIKRYNNNYDGYVLKRNIVNIEGAYYSSHDKKVVNTTLDGYILKENSVNEAITNATISKITAIQSTRYAENYIHKSNAITIRGNIYHKKDVDVICFNGEWYHISQCFINYDRKDINKELEKSVSTLKGNKGFVKQSVFFDKNLSENYMRYLVLTWSFCREKGANIERKGDLIPKKCAITAYNLAYNEALDDIEYQEVHCTNMNNLIQLTTGELIINSVSNKKYLKKFNNKWYIKRTTQALIKDIKADKLFCDDRLITTWLPDKKQLLLF